ncbi:hypothetical protein M3Y99_01656600 [Aphelenchoides fujianensis]|nr:hypothetical protein M3Y99_01656600 [Aphelenchoides fujianensis]
MLSLFSNRSEHKRFGFANLLRLERTKRRWRILKLRAHRHARGRVSGPRLGIESTSAVLEHWLRQGQQAVVHFHDCVLPRPDHLKKMMLLNRKGFLSAQYLFRLMPCEVYAPVETHPYVRKCQKGRLCFFRQHGAQRIVRICFDYELLALFHRLNFVRLPIRRLHVDAYVSKKRLDEFKTMSSFGEAGTLTGALAFINACAPILRHLECDIHLLEAADFPQLQLNEFKTLKVKADFHQIVSLLQQRVHHIDLSELTAADGVSFTETFFRTTTPIPRQSEVVSARLRLNVCQSRELMRNVEAIKRFAPNLRRIHAAIRSAEIKDVELRILCVYSLQPEECFSFRSMATLSIVCTQRQAELTWRPPSSAERPLVRRCESIAFGPSTAPLRKFIHRFVSLMESDYGRAECY